MADGPNPSGLCMCGRTVPAHRAVYERVVGPIPPGVYLDHTCRNRACVNPEHVRFATPAENMRTRKDCVLDANRVALIKRLLLDGGITQRAIAKQFGVSEMTISNIKNGQRWRDIEPAA